MIAGSGEEFAGEGAEPESEEVADSEEEGAGGGSERVGADMLQDAAPVSERSQEGEDASVDSEVLSRHSSRSSHSTLIAEGRSGASSPGSIVYGNSPPMSVSSTQQDDAVDHGASPATRSPATR